MQDRDTVHLNKIHHIAVICADYKKSKEFYTKLLGFKVIREVYRETRGSYKLDLEGGGCMIELFSFPNPPKRPSYPEAAGLRHLAFEVDSVEETVRALAALGVSCEPLRTDEYTGKTCTFFRDPDDLPIELYQK